MTALGQTPPRSSSAGAAAHRWSGARGGLTPGPTWGRRLSLDVAADSATAHAEWQRRTPLVVRLRIHPGPGVAACAAVASEAAGGRRHALIGCGDLRCPVRHWAATRGRTCPRTSGRSCTTRGARTSLHWSSPPRTSPPRDTRRTPFSSCRGKSRLYAVSAAAITGLILRRSDARLESDRHDCVSNDEFGIRHPRAFLPSCTGLRATGTSCASPSPPRILWNCAAATDSRPRFPVPAVPGPPRVPARTQGPRHHGPQHVCARDTSPSSQGTRDQINGLSADADCGASVWRHSRPASVGPAGTYSHPIQPRYPSALS